jgi:hypothetical protein
MKRNSTHLRLVICALALLAALPSLAAKRRAVGKPTVGTPVQMSVKGTVLDAQSGQPVAFATVGIGDHRAVTSREGSFELNDLTVFGSASVIAGRSGYNNSTQTVTGAGTHTLTFHLQGRPSVNLRKIDGTNIPLDDDSIKFGYVVIFGGYVAGTEDDFCTSNGTRVTLPLSQIKRVVGPATLVETACCTRPAQKLRLELRNNTSDDFTFRDSCEGNTVDILGRNHVTGDSVFVPFSQVAEVVFP